MCLYTHGQHGDRGWPRLADGKFEMLPLQGGWAGLERSGSGPASRRSTCRATDDLDLGQATLVTRRVAARPRHEELALHLHGPDAERTSLLVARLNVLQELQHTGGRPFSQLALQEVKKQPV